MQEISKIARAYQATVDHPISNGQIDFVLRQYGSRKEISRSKNPKKASVEEIAVSINNATVKELKIIHNGKEIHLVISDEAGFGRINKPIGLELSEKIVLFHIPPYTTKMNPMDELL